MSKSKAMLLVVGQDDLSKRALALMRADRWWDREDKVIELDGEEVSGFKRDHIAQYGDGVLKAVLDGSRPVLASSYGFITSTRVVEYFEMALRAQGVFDDWSSKLMANEFDKG